MKTQTRRNGTSEVLAGPFIIMRTTEDGRSAFKSKAKGWVYDRAKAWRFDTEQQARFILRGNDGEVISDREPDDAGEALHCARCGNTWTEPKWKVGYLKANAQCPKCKCRYIYPPAGHANSQVHDLVPVATGKMSMAERALLEVYEGKVQKGLESAKEARAALREIRDKRLYRDKFGTFEAYMEKRWGYSARQGHRLVDWAVIESNLLTDGSQNAGDQLVTLPATESQARPLKRLKPAEQREAWQEAVVSAPAGQVTAKHVEAAVAKRLPPPTIADPLPEKLRFDWRESWAEIVVRQVSDGQWASGATVHNSRNTTYSQHVALKPRPAYPCREHAIIAAASIIHDWQAAALKSSSKGSGVYEVASRIQAWALKQHEEAAEQTRKNCLESPQVSEPQKGSPSADYSGVRPAKKGAVQTWDELPLSSGNGQMPSGPVGPSIREAMAYLGAIDDELGRAQDAVMQSNVHRALALLRPVLQKYAGCDNLRAERLDSGTKLDPMVQARFHAIDAQVEAGAALQLLQAAPGVPSGQGPHYHAEKAVDHLNCLKALLNQVEVQKPKGRRS